LSNYDEKVTANTNGGRNNNTKNRDQHHANNGETDRNGPQTQTKDMLEQHSGKMTLTEHVTVKRCAAKQPNTSSPIW